MATVYFNGKKERVFGIAQNNFLKHDISLLSERLQAYREEFYSKKLCICLFRYRQHPVFITRRMNVLT
jgi:hypothetical protein